MNITSKGQVTIPLEIRNKYHFDPNTQVEFVEENDRVYLKGLAPAAGTRFSGLRGRADSGMSTEEILALTRSDPEMDILASQP